jgi:hypothetical protein
MRYRESYVTEGLNAKLAVNTPPGTYRGFRLATHGSNDTITVEADAGSLDHVAIYQTLDGFSLTVRKTGGDYAVDLSSLVDAAQKTWIITIYADYAVGSTTTAVLRAYEWLPTDEFTSAPEKGELVVLGMVTIPAGGGVPIPAGNIVPDKRSFGWANKAEEAVSWSALLKNGGFEFSWDDLGGNFECASAWWWRETTVGDAEWEIWTSAVHSGVKALAWLHQGTPSTGTCAQDLGVPVEPGQLVRYRFYKKCLVVSTGGTCEFVFEWLDDGGDPLSTTDITIDLTGTDADFVEVTGTIAVPTGAYYLHRVAFTNTTLNFGSSTEGFILDDVQVWLESKNQERDQLSSVVGPVWATALALRDRSDPTDFAAYSGALLRYDKTVGQPEWGGIRLYRPSQAGTQSAPALIGHVSDSASHTYSLIREYSPDGDVAIREYISRTSDFVRTVNAAWNISTNQWVKDDPAPEAIRVKHNAANIEIEYYTGAGPFGDGAWTGTMLSTDPSSGTDAIMAAAGVLTSNSLTGQLGQLRDGKHGTKTMWLNAMAAYGGPNDMAGYGLVSAASTGLAAWQSNSSGGEKRLTFPLPLHAGDRLLTVTCYGYSGNDAGEELQAKIFRDDLQGTDAQVSTTKTSPSGYAWRTIGWTTADTDFSPNGHTMVDECYGVWMRLAQSNAGGEILITGIRVTYDHP